MPILSHRPANRKGAKQTDFGSFAPFLRTQTEVRAAMPQALHLPRSLSTAVCFFPPHLTHLPPRARPLPTAINAPFSPMPPPRPQQTPVCFIRLAHLPPRARARFPPQSIRPFRRCRRASNKPQSVPHLAHLPPRAHTRLSPQSMRPFRRYRRASNKPQSVFSPHLAHLPPRARARFPPQSMRPFRRCRRRARSKPQSVSPHLAHLPPRARPLPTAINTPFSPMPPPRPQQTAVCFIRRARLPPRAHTRLSPQSMRPFRRYRRARSKPRSVFPVAHISRPARARFPSQSMRPFHRCRRASNKPRSVSPTFPARKKHRLPQICGRAGASSLDHFTSEVYSAL